MSDFDSDLTDLDEEASSKPQPSAYKIKGALKAPRSTTYTAQALHEQIIGGDVDLEAEYQRDVVWPSVKQIGIIDSIFRNFYVPPVIFAVKYLEDGSERRVCIDGKQRLTSIQRFMDGEIPYKDAFTGEKFFYKDLPGRTEKGKPLPDKYRKIFRNKQIVCMEYQDLLGDDEREIFQRVQLGMALTPAEKLQAISSPTVAFLKSLQNEYVQGNLAEKLEWETSRGSDFRGLAFAVFSIDRWPLDTVPSLSTVTKWLQNDRELDDGFCAKVHETFKIFVALADHPKLKSCFTLKGVKKVSPVEFMVIALLIAQFRDMFTLAQLSEAITKMRLDIRKVEVDIRMNSRVMKPMLAFIKGLKSSQSKASSEEPVAAKAVKGAQEKTSGSFQKLKRKRAELSDDESYDDKNYQESKKSSTSQKSGSPSKSKPFIKSEPPLQTSIPLQMFNSISLTSSTSRETNSQPSHPLSNTSISVPPAPSLQIHPDRLAAIRAAQQQLPERPPSVSQSAFNSWQRPPQAIPLPSPNVSLQALQQLAHAQVQAHNAQAILDSLHAQRGNGRSPREPPSHMSPNSQPSIIPAQDPRLHRPGVPGPEHQPLQPHRITGANAIPVGRRDSGLLTHDSNHGIFRPPPPPGSNGYPNGVNSQGQGFGY